MGESSCLMRSFSEPSEHSGEVKKTDPLSCLGESISFGRYASEPLDWAKWSAFSQNRYLEEAEKFSKPGSVAQKKAYFEAHYKRKAAEKAAALAEVTNTCASKVSESVSEHLNCRRSSIDSESGNVVSQLVIDGNQQENIVSNSEAVYSADVNHQNANVERNVLEIAEVDGVEAVLIQESVDVEDDLQVEVENNIQKDSLQVEMESFTRVEMESFTQDEIENQFKNVNNEIVYGTIQEEKMPKKKGASEETVAATIKKRLVNSSLSRLSTQGRMSKIPSFGAKQVSGVLITKKDNATPKCKTLEADLVDKRRSATKSLHMSINFTSHAGETCKRISPVSEKIKNLRVDALNVPVKSTASRQTTTRASVNGVLKQSSVNPWSKDGREKTIHNKSVAGSVTIDGIGKLPSKEQVFRLYMCASQFSTENGIKPRGLIKPCPFSLRSEERAAKRKEFFQRLEEKKNGEAEYKQLQIRSKKEKAVVDVKKLSHNSNGLKAKLNEDLSPGSHLPINNLKKKIPPTRSHPQKVQRQSTTSKVQPSTRASAISHISKRLTEKHNPRTSQSVTSLPKKNAHENSSPNIQG